MEGVEVDREEHADRDQEQLGRLVDAEPQDHQRDQRQRAGCCAPSAGVESSSVSAQREASRSAGPAAGPGRRRWRSPASARPVLIATWLHSSPDAASVQNALHHRQRRGQHARRQPAQRRRELPARPATGTSQGSAATGSERAAQAPATRCSSAARGRVMRFSSATPRGHVGVGDDLAERPGQRLAAAGARARSSGSSGNTSSAKR